MTLLEAVVSLGILRDLTVRGSVRRTVLCIVPLETPSAISGPSTISGRQRDVVGFYSIQPALIVPQNPFEFIERQIFVVLDRRNLGFPSCQERKQYLRHQRIVIGRVGRSLEGALKLSEFPYVTLDGLLPIVLDVLEVPPN